MFSNFTCTRRKVAFLLSLLAFLFPRLLNACDTSGFLMNGITDNGNGTFTINWTVLVAGGNTTGVGSTWGFYLNVDATILSITPTSFTSANGTTLNGVVSGGNIAWGNPAPSAAPPFLNIATEPGDQSFNFSMTVQGPPTEWWGGGQEANQCPGGAGTSLENYEGEFPCFPPTISAVTPEVHICPGGSATLSVMTNYLAQTVTWQPGGQTGNTVTVSPSDNTTYTITAANAACEVSTEITVIVDPLPVLQPFEDQVTICQGQQAILGVSEENVNTVAWTPGNSQGPVLIVTPATSPATYTATGVNHCGSTSVQIVVTTQQFPSITTGSNQTICAGESVTLSATATNALMVTWQPGGQAGTTVNVSPTSTTTYQAIAENACGKDTAVVQVSVAPNVTNTVQLSACAGESVLYNGISLAAGSTSTFTYNSAAGCDSVVTVNVASLPIFTNQLQLTACKGETVPYNGQNLAPGSITQHTFTAFNGCDSVVTVSVTELPEYALTVTLAACDGENVVYNGQSLPAGTTTVFNLQTFAGCDSVVTVTVNEFPVFNTTLTLQTCVGTTVTYNGQQLAGGTVTPFTFNTIHGCDSVVTVTVNELTMFTSEVAFQACTGTTVTYNGQSLAAGSVTSFDFTSVQGCDSVVTVTVEEVNAILETLTFEACVGQTIIYEGQSLPPGTSTDFPFQTPQGCDSIVTVIVNMLETYAENLFLETCEGEPVVYHNTNLPPGSVTPFTLTAANGCDSVVTVFVEEILVPHTTLPLSACSGETVFYQGQNLLPGTTMDFIFTAHTGCDSIVTVTVAELPAYASDLTLQACNGSTVVYNGVPLTPGTTVAFTFPAVNGCDSTVNVTVEEVDIFTTALSFDACQGETITYNGQVLLPNTITDFTYVSSIGCDSIVTVAVNELPAYDVPVLLQACTGSTVIYNGQQLSPGSVTSFNFNTVNGCDSIVTVTVEEVSVLTSSQSLSACEGTVAIYNGQALQPGTVTLFSFTSTQGCDSIVTVTVVGLPNQASSIQLAACDGETVVYNGQSLPAGTTIPFTFQTWQGCDSVVTVSVHAFPTQTSTLTLEACDGSSILYHGQSIAAGSTTDVILTSVNGCDSIVTVTVGALPHANSSVTLQGCEGESLVYNGQTIQPNTTETFTFTAFNGCDSLVTVTALPPVPKVETEETLEVCEGNSALIFGQEISIPGTYSQSFTGSNGCDSTHTVNLSVVDKVLLFFPADLTIELGDTVQLNPSVHPAGLSFVWEPSPSLSCLDCENPLAFPQQTTDYTVTASDPNGCEKTATQRVFVDKSRGVYVPNAFSPNGDGLNDFFMIYSDGRSVKEVKSFLVFSRWGESIYQGYHFQPDDPAFSWDGLHKGKELDPAVFVWFADIEFIDGVSQVFKGDVTLAK